MEKKVPTKKQAQKWANELRSGKYQQCKGELENINKKFCCLGVACKTFIPSNAQVLVHGILYGSFPDDQKQSPKWLINVDSDVMIKLGYRLSFLNDANDYTFDEIADLIELVYVHKAIV
jgi:hypothetical protein